MNESNIQINKEKVSVKGTVVTAPYLVEKVWYDNEGKQIIILMDYTAQPGTQQFRNLVAYNLYGKQIWEAELPTASGVDAYVDASMENGDLRASSFSCFLCSIDLTSGKILRKDFSK